MSALSDGFSYPYPIYGMFLPFLVSVHLCRFHRLSSWLANPTPTIFQS